MAPTRVLRFARSDDESAFVLLQVTPKDSRPLDLNQDPLPGIQATATVQSESSISITIRKETQGITQRLGAITLKHDDEQPIELFEWCGAAVEASASSKQAVVNLTTQSRDSEAAVAQLQSQLEELIQAKHEDETALLRKFRDLLNEKKVKIREQQQVLAAGSFNASHPGSSQPSQIKQEGEPAEPAVPAKSARKAGRSRTTKRKTPASKRVEEEESDEDAPVQAMDVDVKQEVEDTDPGETTDATASVTSDDDDEDANSNDEDEAGSSSKTAKTASKSQAESREIPTKKATRQPPPRRDLPFNNKPTRSAPAPIAPGDSETDSDDEL
ncbi:hypothetical protein QQZ08_002874 [Neonectria magnoliae]|uniref:Mitotic apparatus protein p62 n=1 Tax=Neonectria magnoliae TaxID=2732573 RepID=A0ABR1ICC1_9HYPO